MILWNNLHLTEGEEGVEGEGGEEGEGEEGGEEDKEDPIDESQNQGFFNFRVTHEE